MRLLGVLLCVIGLFQTASAQNDKEAYEHFKKARTAYEAKDYTESAWRLQKVNELLGKPQIRTQPMLIKSLYNIEDWRAAKEEIKGYYGLNPNKELVEYTEIVGLERKVDAKISEEDADYNRALSAKSVSDMQSYLSKYPYGKYRSNATANITTFNDDAAWEYAQSKSNSAAYWDYIDKYPSGNHFSTAKATVIRWDAEAWEKAEQTNTISSYEYYLKYYPRGNFREYAQTNLDNLKDAELRAYNRQQYQHYMSLSRQAKRRGVGRTIGGVVGLTGNLALMAVGTASAVYGFASIDYDDYSLLYVLAGSAGIGWSLGRLIIFDKFSRASSSFKESREYKAIAQRYTYF
ncbi:MAG: outer membrane protein assembly factor BamD [Bacteroidetes bacterium]|nr:outer membrane protein assembly factor BamD [Bacteroidota bacterium]